MNDPIPGHTVKRYDGELEHLHYLVLDMGSLVLRQVENALAAFKARDEALARRVIAIDQEVDRMEVWADSEIAQLVARRSPVGNDLRRVLAVSKSIADLERIGDEAARIAGLALQPFLQENHKPSPRLLGAPNQIGEHALAHLRLALEAFEDWDEAKARRALAGHWQMEDEFQSLLRYLTSYVFEDCRNISLSISLTLAAKSLERIGHHARNIVEHVLFQAGSGQDAPQLASAGSVHQLT